MRRVLALITTLLVATLNASLAAAAIAKPTITQVVYNLTASPKTMTVTGKSFVSPLTIKIGSTALPVASLTSTSLVANVPSTLAAGDYILTVTNAGGSATWTLTYGAVGPQGPQGVQGVAGPAGANGDIGATGSVGPRGVAGEVGAPGPTGADGSPGKSIHVVDRNGRDLGVYMEGGLSAPILFLPEAGVWYQLRCRRTDTCSNMEVVVEDQLYYDALDCSGPPLILTRLSDQVVVDVLTDRSLRYWTTVLGAAQTRLPPVTTSTGYNYSARHPLDPESQDYCYKGETLPYPVMAAEEINSPFPFSIYPDFPLSGRPALIVDIELPLRFKWMW